MKNFKYRLNKGFTLIELLLVISVISLLSSILLATVNSANDKARASKIKTEMGQFIIALEMYRSDNAEYPYENIPFSGTVSYKFDMNQNNSVTHIYGPDLRTLLAANTVPKHPLPSSLTSTSWAYRTNAGTTKYRCLGDTTNPRYVITVPITSNAFMYEAFSSWKSLENATTNTVVNPAERCYSVK